MPGAPLSLLEREEISRLLTLNPQSSWASIARQLDRHPTSISREVTRHGGRPDEALFPTRAGNPLSHDAVQRLVRKHAATAAVGCPSIRSDQIHPHVLRHSCAMSLLQAGVDTAVIALWLGNADIRSTNAYLHADMTIKQRALDRTTPTNSPPGRYQPADSLLAFLEAL